MIGKEFKIPDGYDSIVVYDLEWPQGYNFSYYITNQSQAIYTNQVRFWHEQFDILDEIVCENCNSNQAQIYCKNDDIHLCAECDELVHEDASNDAKMFVMKWHQWIPFDQKPIDYGNCSEHPTRKLELYCMTCDKAICSDCKLKGSH